MTPQELEIAQAAISAPHSTTYDEIYERISESTGVDIEDVRVIVRRLVEDHILHIHAGPTGNMSEGGEVAPVARGWYSQGSMWK